MAFGLISLRTGFIVGCKIGSGERGFPAFPSRVRWKGRDGGDSPGNRRGRRMKRASDFFRTEEKLNCAQAVLRYFEFPPEKIEALRAAGGGRAPGGLCGALGNNYLIKALEKGELSVLGPINAYKSVVAMIIGIFLLGELPSLIGLFAVVLIIWGSYYIFDTTEDGFSLSLLNRSAIRWRLYALVLTAVEAVFIKDVILHSNVQTAFCFWCWFGTLFSFANVVKHRERLPKFKLRENIKLAAVITCVGIMQYSTNFVFERINVSYALALFQLSAILSVILGWKFFAERNIVKKLTGTLIMVFGAVLLILLK